MRILDNIFGKKSKDNSSGQTTQGQKNEINNSKETSALTCFAFFTRSPMKVISLSNDRGWKEKIREVMNAPYADIFIIEYPDWYPPTLKSLSNAEIKKHTENIAGHMRQTLVGFFIPYDEIERITRSFFILKIPTTLRAIFVVEYDNRLIYKKDPKYLNLEAGTIVEKTSYYKCEFCGEGGAAEFFFERTGFTHLEEIYDKKRDLSKFNAGDLFGECPNCGPATGWSKVDWILPKMENN